MGFRTVLLPLCLLLHVEQASAGRVKQALFNMFGSSRHASKPDGIEHDAEQLEMIEFLKTSGYSQYTTPEYVAKLDDDLAYDSIEDLCHLVEDEDYDEIKMPREDAEVIQRLARKEILKRFLLGVPLPEGAPSDTFAQQLENLMAAGYDEPEDVADLEEDEAKGMGIQGEFFTILTTFAEEYDARELLHIILVSLVVKETGATPYAEENVWRPMVDALVKAGVRSLADIAQLTPAEVPTLDKEDLQRLKSDERVLMHTHKQEL